MHRSGLDVGAVIAFVMFDERVAQPIISLSQTPLNWVSTLLKAVGAVRDARRTSVCLVD